MMKITIGIHALQRVIFREYGRQYTMKRNLFLYFTAFFCGMSVMAVELSASRLLAPFFSSSATVWTVIIGLIMISMSFGNILGGRSADKHNSMGRLYFLIWLASLWIALIPFVGKYIISATIPIIMLVLPGNLLVAGSVLSCILLFSFPLIILGMVSPYLIKLGVNKDMDNSGKTTGEIYAASTIGSILGTFLPTFVTIPTIGTNKTFLVFALVLNLLSLYYLVKNRAKRVKNWITAFLILALTIIPMNNSYAFWKNGIVYEGESLYNYVQVSENNDAVILSTNVAFGVQSIYKKNSTLTGYYYDYALMAPFFSSQTHFDGKLDVLILGLGTGTYAKQIKRFFPNASIDGVEIDPTIAELSKEYFELKEGEATIYINDGRAFLKSMDTKKYDVIMVDAYHDITIPFHMSTIEFFTDVKEHLKENGVIVTNLNMRSETNTEMTDYLTQTIKHVMKKVYTYAMPSATNLLLFASNDSSCRENYRSNIAKVTESHPLYAVMQRVDENLREITESKKILTDDLAPVEIMGQRVLDEIVEESAKQFREEVRSSDKGIWGIFEMLSE